MLRSVQVWRSQQMRLGTKRATARLLVLHERTRADLCCVSWESCAPHGVTCRVGCMQMPAAAPGRIPTRCVLPVAGRVFLLCVPLTQVHTQQHVACPGLPALLKLCCSSSPLLLSLSSPGHRYRALNVQAGTQFCDGGFEGEVAAGRISSSSLDKYSCVALAGVLARWVICGVKQQCRARNKPNSGPVCVGRSKSKSGLCVWRLSRAACDWHGWCQPDGGCSCGELTLHVE